VLDGIVARGAPVGANRSFTQLRKMCNWAVSRGLIERSPCERIASPSPESPRDRVLDLNEIGLIWLAAEQLGYPFGPIVKLLVLTGQRRGEIGGMEWKELDLEKRVWTIPVARSKNRRQHVVPLSPQAIEIIESVPRFEGAKFVFSPWDRPPGGFAGAKSRLNRLVTLANEGAPIPAWTLHDCRRSTATQLAAIGISLHVTEKILNHVSGSFGGIVSVYQKHSFANEMRDALDRWDRKIKALINGDEGRVIELPARA
jgi:integrase